MGSYKLGGIQNRTVPNICSFAKQKKSIITIRDTSDSNDCLLRAFAVGVALNERKNSGRYKPLSREESQTAEKKQLLYRFKGFDGFDFESGSTNRCTMEELTILASSFFLKQYMITLFDRNFMGVFIKNFIDGKDKHIDLLYDRANYHVDVISSTKGLFMVRHYCYVCQKGCSDIKHLCTGSCCVLCRQPNCKNRLGYITSSEQPGRTTGFKCDTFGLVLRSQDCLDNHIETRFCSLYLKCSSCSGTKLRHSIANHSCSKKRCSICSQYFDHFSQEVHECFVQRPKINVKSTSNTNVPGSSTRITNEREEEPLVDDVCIWFFDIETEQSCNNRNEHVPVLLVVQNVEKLEHVFLITIVLQTFVLQSLKMKHEFANKNGSVLTLAVDLIFCPFVNGYTSNKGLFPKDYCVATKLFQ